MGERGVGEVGGGEVREGGNGGSQLRPLRQPKAT